MEHEIILATRRHTAPAEAPSHWAFDEKEFVERAVENEKSAEAADYDGATNNANTEGAVTTITNHSDSVKDTTAGTKEIVEEEGEVSKETDAFETTISTVKSPVSVYSNSNNNRGSIRKPSTSTRGSIDAFFRNFMLDDSDQAKRKNKSNKNKNKRSSALTSDSSRSSASSSVYSSIFNFDDRRFSGLSDRMKMALKGGSGSGGGSGSKRQHQLDPLEQWMVKHSGGTLRDAHTGKAPRESSDEV